MDITLILSKLGKIPTQLAQAIVIILLGLLVLRLIQVFRKRLEHRINSSKADLQQQSRLKTLLSAGNHLATFVWILIVTLMVLLVFEIDITPILASVGVVSLAISLGAQSIIRDYIGGVLILLEDQFRVGDAVTIAGNAGTVEEISLRATRLRDVEGRLILIPNGDIRILSRAGYDWARAVVDLNIPFNADIGTVVEVLNDAMQRAKEDPQISTFILEQPQVQGWNSFTPGAVQVRLMAKTVPDKRLEIGAVLRQYAQEALRNADLQVASPLQDQQAGGNTL